MARIVVGTAGGLVEIGSAALRHAGHVITALDFDGSQPWALLDDTTIVPALGERPRASLPDGVEGASLLATKDRVLVGTEGAHLFRVDGSTLSRIEPFEDAPARAKWYTPWGGPPALRSMTEMDGEIYANVHVGGILRSRDLNTWEQTIDIDTDVHQVIHDRDGRLFAALGVEGVAGSEDRGDTWTITTEGLHGTYVRAAATAGDALIVAASTGPFSKHAALYRRARASTGGFEPCGGGLPERFGSNIDTHWLASDGETVAVVSPGGDVFTSTDEGTSWACVAHEVGTPRCLLVFERD